MPRARTGKIFLDWHGDEHSGHWDLRFSLPDGSRSKRECQPNPTRELGETIEHALLCLRRKVTEARFLLQGALLVGERQTAVPIHPLGEVFLILLFWTGAGMRRRLRRRVLPRCPPHSTTFLASQWLCLRGHSPAN